MRTVIVPDGVARCEWAAEPELNRTYHDEEWGRAVTDDRRLFEKLCLEGFQAGLSWITILRKRDAFRAAFAGFAPAVVAKFGEEDISRLLSNPGIVRHEGKIRAAIDNAGRALALAEEQGSLAAYFWGWAEKEPPEPTEWVAYDPVSTALSKDLKRRGWSFVGPTTVYAFMQAMGLVNDHVPGCHARHECAEMRQVALTRFT